MSQKLTHFAFIASFLVILLGLTIDQKKVSKFCSTSKTQEIEQTHNLNLKVDFNTTIDILGNFVESIVHKLLSTNNCSSNIDNNKALKVKKLDAKAKCVS